MDKATIINFYECIRDLAFATPYASLSVEEVESIISHCDAWAAMLITHSDLTEQLGDQAASHFEMVMALPNAVRTARQSRTYPKVLLSEVEYMASMDFLYNLRRAKAEVALALNRGAFDSDL